VVEGWVVEGWVVAGWPVEGLVGVVGWFCPITAAPVTSAIALTHPIMVLLFIM
jgi:hypothetical protein